MNNHQPPKYLLRFFRWFCHPDYAEDIEGDLIEKYERYLKKYDLKKAKWKFTWAVLGLFRPSLIRNFENPFLQNISIMLQHNFKVSMRTLWRDKGFSLINIGGLALGMAVALLIGLWIHDELIFNQYHKNYDSIVQVKRQENPRGQAERITSNHQVSALGTLLKNDYQNHFERVVMMRQLEEIVLATDSKSFTQEGHFMQWEGAEMLTLKMLHGSRDGQKDQNSIFLSKTLAEKFYGPTNPINQVIKLAGAIELKVTGVYEDLPNNSQFAEATFFSSLKLYLALTGADENAWDNYNMMIYAQIHPETNITVANEAIKKELANHLPELLSQEFIVLIGIACLLASPIAYYFANNWLSDFVYRIDISWSLFGLVGLGALFITLMTISFQALRAALRNPVEAIRTE